MMKKVLKTRWLPPLAFASALLGLTIPASAADFYLRAAQTTVTMPGGEIVTMWGFAEENSTWDSGNPVTVPGPRLVVPPADSTVTIYVQNDLAVPVSLVIPAQIQASTVARLTEADLDYPAPPGTGGRINSFATETAPGNMGIYSWTSFEPGTFVYFSGRHPQVQVQMGLYGGITKDFAAGEAYDGVVYDNEVYLFYSEIDTDLHTAIDTPGGYGPAGTLMTSTRDYAPEYALINGQPWPDAMPIVDHPIEVGETVLVRFLSASLEAHIPTLHGAYFDIVAEDGRLYPYPFKQYTVTLTPQKTHDALFEPTRPGEYAILDRALHLTNGPNASGGMLVKLDVAAEPGSPFGTADAYFLDEDQSLAVPGGAFADVLDNDSDGGAPGVTLSAVLEKDVLHGVLAFDGADGSFTYTPDPDFFGADFFLYTIDDGSLESEPVAAVIRVDPVNDPPVAVSDNLETFEDVPLTLDDSGFYTVLDNDSDIDGDTLTAALIGGSGPTHGSIAFNPDGTFVYTPNPDYFGPDGFQYGAFDGQVFSSAVSVSIDVLSVNDIPEADDDELGSIVRNTPYELAAPGVLANDSDLEGDPMTAVLSSPPLHGVVELNPDGSLTYNPDVDYVGPDSFTYKANDGTANSTQALVSFEVVVDDAFFADGFESGDLSAWAPAP